MNDSPSQAESIVSAIAEEQPIKPRFEGNLFPVSHPEGVVSAEGTIMVDSAPTPKTVEKVVPFVPPKPQTLASVLVRNYARASKKANSSEWDDLNSVAACIGTGLVEMHDAIDRNYSLLQNANYTSPELIKSIQTYTKDIDILSKDLMQISSLHEGKTGSAVNNDDYAESLQIFEQYRNLDIRLKAVILPVNITITDALLDARSKVIAEDSIDPNVVTDVVAKEMIIDASVDTTDSVQFAAAAMDQASTHIVEAASNFNIVENNNTSTSEAIPGITS